MKKYTLWIILILVLLTVSISLASGGNNYTLTWWTADGGGSVSTGGNYALQGTVGQPDAGEMVNGRYTLQSGYWNGLDQYGVYLPLVIRP